MDDDFYDSMARKGRIMLDMIEKNKLVTECKDYLHRAIAWADSYFDFCSNLLDED